MSKKKSFSPPTVETAPNAVSGSRLSHDEIMEQIREPYAFTDKEIIQFLEDGVISRQELINQDIFSSNALDRLLNFTYPGPFYENLDFDKGDDFSSLWQDSTDVHFWGGPGVGTTLLLAGLTGCEGDGYEVDFSSDPHNYTSTLYQFVIRDGLTAPGTIDIHCRIPAKIPSRKAKGAKKYAVNFAERGDKALWEVFGRKNKTFSESFILNPNHNIIFLLVDSTCGRVRIRYTNEYGDITCAYIDNGVLLRKFVDWLISPAADEERKRIDAVHFIVTKADTLGHTEAEQAEAAERLVQSPEYANTLTRLSEFCRSSRQLNASTDYKVKVIPYSLGRFYPGGVFDYNPSPSRRLVEFVGHLLDNRSPSIFRRLTNMFRH